MMNYRVLPVALLSVIQLIIPSLLSQKLVVGTALNDAALFQDHDAVAVADCRETVGDHEGRPAFHKLVHAVLYQLFGSGINGTGCLVKDQHRRICNGGAGDGEKLSLALAQVCSVSSEKGVVALWKPADETIGVGKLCCCDYLFICGI